mgnify:CR=1 FL=1
MPFRYKCGINLPPSCRKGHDRAGELKPAAPPCQQPVSAAVLGVDGKGRRVAGSFFAVGHVALLSRRHSSPRDQDFGARLLSRVVQPKFQRRPSRLLCGSRCHEGVAVVGRRLQPVGMCVRLN